MGSISARRVFLIGCIYARLLIAKCTERASVLIGERATCANVRRALNFLYTASGSFFNEENARGYNIVAKGGMSYCIMPWEEKEG